jgi:hypothetical protein
LKQSDRAKPAPIAEGPVVEIRLGLKGRVSAHCIRPDGTVRPDSVVEMDNMIVDAGLNALASANSPNTVASIAAWAAVGSGSALPTASDTTLQSPVSLGGVARTQTSHTGNNGVTSTMGTSTLNRVLKFPAAAADTILREFGFFSASSGGIMWNRERFRNTGGDPIDYTVLADEELVLSLAVVLNYDLSDVATQFTLTFNDGTPDQVVDVVVRPQAAGSNAWSPLSMGFPAFAGPISGAADTVVGLVANTTSWAGNVSSSRTAAPYVAGSFQLDVTHVWEPANITSTINRLAFLARGDGGTGRLFQASVSPGLPKTSNRRLRVTFRITWGRS